MAWPKTNNPRTEFVTLRLTVGEAQELDTLAALAGQTRSEFVRSAVRTVVAAAARRARKKAAMTNQINPGQTP